VLSRCLPPAAEPFEKEVLLEEDEEEEIFNHDKNDLKNANVSEAPPRPPRPDGSAARRPVLAPDWDIL